MRLEPPGDPYLFYRHDNLNCVQAVQTKIVREVRSGLDLLDVSDMKAAYRVAKNIADRYVTYIGWVVDLRSMMLAQSFV